jgi:hypothetical protein
LAPNKRLVQGYHSSHGVESVLPTSSICDKDPIIQNYEPIL